MANMIKTFVMLLLLCVGQVNAEQPKLWVLTNLEPPFSQQNERGQFEGIIVDITNGILGEAGIDQQILAAPWERVFKEAASKANVMTVGVARIIEREDQFIWLTPMTSAIVGVFSLDAPKEPIGQLSELNLTDSIGVLDGDYRLTLLQQAGATNIVILNSWLEGTEKLLDGKISNLFLSTIGIQLMCKKLQRDCHHVKRILTYEQITAYVALSKGTDSITIARLTKAAASYKNSQAFKQTTQKWISQYEQQNGLQMHLDKGVINLWAKD